MKAKNLSYQFTILAVFFVIIATMSFSGKHINSVKPTWCDKTLRPELKKLKEIKITRPWFKVYDVGQHTYAIAEPYNYEETISYLIIGSQRALLFDTGMGLDSISLVVSQLTKLPVQVLNSHTHPDHIGGNHEFHDILAMNTAYTHSNANNGYSHLKVRGEVSPAALCLARLPQKDTAHYHIRPFKVSKFIADGYTIDLGNRQLKVIATPGHTPDAICLYDKQARYLWTGDSFYQGPIFLFADETDLKAYRHSINAIARFATISNRLLPAHNLPVVAPEMVIDAAKDFNGIADGHKKGVPAEYYTVMFNFGKFSYQIGRRFLPK